MNNNMKTGSYSSIKPTTASFTPRTKDRNSSAKSFQNALSSNNNTTVPLQNTRLLKHTGSSLKRMNEKEPPKPDAPIRTSGGWKWA
jgi:hypothetical protein